MDKILTVVIPTYNGEKYVARAVRSVLDQPAGDQVNILLVDDGSTDSTGAVCDDLARAHENVQVIHKPNGGVSSARNMGIDHVTTKYVAFLDCDDWWNDGFFDQTLLEELSREDACDAYQFSFWQVDLSCRQKRVTHVKEELFRYGENGLGRYDWAYHCSFILSTGLLHRYGVRYPAARVGEDGPFIEMALYFVRTFRRMDRVMFSYWMNADSCVHTTRMMEAVTEAHKANCQKAAFLEAHGEQVDTDVSLVWSVANRLPDLCAVCGHGDLRKFMQINCYDILARRPDIHFGPRLWNRLGAYEKHPRLYWLKYRMTLGVCYAAMDLVKKIPGVYRVADYWISRLRRGYTPL